MPQLEFFAARDDQLNLLGFIFQDGIRVLEHSSRPDSECREFHSPEEIDQSFPPGVGRMVAGPYLALWVPSAISSVSFRRIDFDPARVKNARFRYEPESGGLMQLYLGGVSGSVLGKTHFGHNSEARALKWNIQSNVNWPELMRVSRRIQSHIRNRMAVEKVPGRPILEQAAQLRREGWLLKEETNARYHWEPEGLVPDN